MNVKKSTVIKLGMYLLLLGAVFGICYQLYETTGEKAGPKIILIPKKIDESNEFWSSVIAGAQVASKEYNVELSLMAPETETDVEGQNRLILEAAGKRPDAILVSPCSYEGTASSIRQAVNQGVKVVLIDSNINESLSIPLVATDNVEIGRKLGEYMKKLLPENPQIGLVGHVKGSSTAIDREKGIRAGLGKEAEAIEEVVFCDSIYQEAYDVTLQLLKRHPEINMIAGFNEYSSLGAASAVRDLGLKGKVKTFGIDNSVSQIQLLESGVYQALAIQNPFNMGYLGIEEAVKGIEGGKTDLFLNSGSKLVTVEDIYTEENEKLLFPFLGSRATKKEEINSQ